jgi:cytochrome bd ubiquinol oxidase subunit II
MVTIWLLLLVLTLVLYVVLDGFDLGAGVLSLFTRDAPRREAMMSSIGSIWDANETWLLVAGTILFGAFPPVYSVVLNALYLPISVMLFGIIFRAVSFEFRVWSTRKRFWEAAFGAGSLMVVLGQGFAVGGLLSGIAVRDNLFAGGAWDWFNPFSVLVAVAVSFGYAMLGSSYLIRKMPFAMLERVRAQMAVSATLMLCCAAIATITAPFLVPAVLERWLAESWRFYLPALGIGGGVALVMLALATRFRSHTTLPLVVSMTIIVLTLAGGLAVAYPWLVPPSITITQAAAPSPILFVMLFGIGLFIPLLLVYNVYLYRVFRGREEEGEGYGYGEE